MVGFTAITLGWVLLHPLRPEEVRSLPVLPAQQSFPSQQLEPWKSASPSPAGNGTVWSLNLVLGGQCSLTNKIMSFLETRSMRSHILHNI